MLRWIGTVSFLLQGGIPRPAVLQQPRLRSARTDLDLGPTPLLKEISLLRLATPGKGSVDPDPFRPMDLDLDRRPAAPSTPHLPLRRWSCRSRRHYGRPNPLKCLTAAPAAAVASAAIRSSVEQTLLLPLPSFPPRCTTRSNSTPYRSTRRAQPDPYLDPYWI